jgi:chromosome segregation ATPase
MNQETVLPYPERRMAVQTRIWPARISNCHLPSVQRFIQAHLPKTPLRSLPEVIGESIALQERRQTSNLEKTLSEARSVASNLSQELQASVRKGDQLAADLRAEREAGERARARAQQELAACTLECEKLQKDLREELENRKRMDAAYEGELGVRKGLEGDLGATRKALADVTNEARQLRIDVSVLRTLRGFDQTSTLSFYVEKMV